jgi:REP element-mobilizing transposase RayT
MTITLVDWINLFDEEPFRNIVLDALRFAQQTKGLVIHAYVIMRSHLHLIVRAKPGFILWAIIRDFKKYASKAIAKELENGLDEKKWPLMIFRNACRGLKQYKEYRKWQDGYRGIYLTNELMFYQKLNYIHNNTVKANLVKSAEDFEFSSARDYVGKVSVLEVTSI